MSGARAQVRTRHLEHDTRPVLFSSIFLFTAKEHRPCQKFVLSIRRSVSGKMRDRNPTDEVQIDDPLAAVHFATPGTLFRHTDSCGSEIKREAMKCGDIGYEDSGETINTRQNYLWHRICACLTLGFAFESERSNHHLLEDNYEKSTLVGNVINPSTRGRLFCV